MTKSETIAPDDLHWVSPFDGMGLDEAEEFWGQKGRIVGPVEAELRRVGARWWWIDSVDAGRVWSGAMLSLGIFEPVEGLLGPVAQDVSSEAIEAAGALGL